MAGGESETEAPCSAQLGGPLRLVPVVPPPTALCLGGRVDSEVPSLPGRALLGGALPLPLPPAVRHRRWRPSRAARLLGRPYPGPPSVDLVETVLSVRRDSTDSRASAELVPQARQQLLQLLHGAEEEAARLQPEVLDLDLSGSENRSAGSGSENRS